MPFEKPTLAWKSDIELMGGYSTSEDKLRDFLFADDCALNAGSPGDMQHSMDMSCNACSNFGLTISTKKTEVMYKPAPKNPYQEPTATVNGKKLATVDKFVYLGSTLSCSVHIDDETHARIAKASFAFGRLRSSVCERKGVSLSTKLSVYKTIVLTTLHMQVRHGQYNRGTPKNSTDFTSSASANCSEWAGSSPRH